MVPSCKMLPKFTALFQHHRKDKNAMIKPMFPDIIIGVWMTSYFCMSGTCQKHLGFEILVKFIQKELQSEMKTVQEWDLPSYPSPQR